MSGMNTMLFINSCPLFYIGARTRSLYITSLTRIKYLVSVSVAPALSHELASAFVTFLVSFRSETGGRTYKICGNDVAHGAQSTTNRCGSMDLRIRANCT